MGCAPSPPWSSCSRPLPAVCSASPRCCPTSPCWDFPWLPASSCRATSNLTSGVLAVAAPLYLGATIGLYSCIGFGASFLGTLLFGVTLDLFGGTSQLAAWAVSFGICGLACLAGAAATVFL